MAPVVFTISAARQKFFDLYRVVTSHFGRKVIITARGALDHAVLVAESYLSELESKAERLREIEAGRALPADEFRLIGSGKIIADVDDPLAEIRREARLSADRKQASLAKRR